MKTPFHGLAELTCALLALATLPASQSPASQSPEHATQTEEKRFPTDSVMLIDGTPIPGEDLGRWLLEVYGEGYAREYATDVFLLEKEAQRLGLAVSEERVRAEVDKQFQIRIALAFGGVKEGWLAELQRTGRSEAGVLVQRFEEERSDMLGKAVAAVDRVVPEEYIESEWELRYGRKGLRHDLMMMKFEVITPSAPAGPYQKLQEKLREDAMEAGRQRALAVRARLLAGEDFALLARKESDDPDALEQDGPAQRFIKYGDRTSGGLAKDFIHYGWPPAFLDEVDMVPPGAVSGPIFGNGGWWLVKKLATRETPLAQVREEITKYQIEQGPSSYEVGLLKTRLSRDLKIELSPELFSETKPSEWAGSDPTAFTVNGEQVKRSTYALWLLRTKAEFSAQTFAEHWLVKKKARERGIEVSQEDLRERQEDYAQNMVDAKFKGKREAWSAYLAETGRTQESFLYNAGVRAYIDLLVEKMIKADRRISEEEIRARHEEIYGPGGKSFDARLVLVGPPVSPPPDPNATSEELQRIVDEGKQSASKLALDIVRRVRAGEDFGALAEKYSKEPDSRKRGGALPGRFRPEQWPEDIAKAVTALAPGDCSEPIALMQGWAIFERGPDRFVPLEDVHDEIKQQLYDERPTEAAAAFYRNALGKESKIDVLPAMSR